MFPTHPLDPTGGPSVLYVVTAISNPARYTVRYQLYRNFEQHILNSGAVLVTVETAFGDRPHEVTERGHPWHVQLRTRSELWHKENMLNIGISRLPANWQYAAWLDADVAFARPDWVQETINQLQHHPLVQLFEVALDLTPDYVPFQQHVGFAYKLAHHAPDKPTNYLGWHPGYAWAATREALDALGGLIDTAILGAADRHMAMSLVGRVEDSFHPGVTDGYRNPLLAWQERALRHIRSNVGYVPGTLLHHWHGKKADRRYLDRWRILVDREFDPERDVKRDWQGLWQLTDHNPGLRDDLRAYFRQRNEDGLELDKSKVPAHF